MIHPIRPIGPLLHPSHQQIDCFWSRSPLGGMTALGSSPRTSWMILLLSGSWARRRIAGIPPDESRRLAVEPQAAFVLGPVVTFVAIGCKNRLNVANEIDLVGLRRDATTGVASAAVAGCTRFKPRPPPPTSNKRQLRISKPIAHPIRFPQGRPSVILPYACSCQGFKEFRRRDFQFNGRGHSRATVLIDPRRWAPVQQVGSDLWSPVQCYGLGSCDGTQTLGRGGCPHRQRRICT